MKSDKFRSKVSACQLCRGIVVTMTDSVVCELAGVLGFDFVWIDAEHGTFNPETIARHIVALKSYDCASFVRVQWNEWGVIKPILDMAPDGVIIPMVNSVEAAEAAVSSCRYPPIGRRGCGSRRGRRFGFVSLHTYMDNSKRDPLVIIQVEHIDSVANLDAILKVPGIDSICIGPSDLSASMGKFCQLDDPEVNRVLDEIAIKVKRAGLMLGTADNLTPAWRTRGVDWIACNSDLGLMLSSGQQLLADK